MIYEQIGANKLKSALLVLVFFLLIALLAYLFSVLTGYGNVGVIIAFAVSMLLTLGSYYYSDRIVLKISGARPATKEEQAYLVNTVEGLSIAAGIPQPKIFVIEDSAPNAFATGRDPRHAVICVTTGLLKKMNRQELEGVVAHEMSHIKNFDTRLMMVVAVMVGIVALLSDWMLRSFLWGGRNREENRVGIALIVVGLVLAILTPLIATLIQLAISRRREFLADASGALLTRYPLGLANALKKLEADKEPLEAANKATAHLYIVNPLKDHKSWLNKLFSTHPPIKERIAALEKM